MNQRERNRAISNCWLIMFLNLVFILIISVENGNTVLKERIIDTHKFGKTIKEETAKEKRDQNYSEAKTGIKFPLYLCSLKLESVVDFGKEYNKPELGVSIRYVGEPPTRADIYIYDLGKKKLDTGVNSPEVKSHFEQVKEHIYIAEKSGIYQEVKKVSEFQTKIETATGNLAALGASFTFKQPNEPYKGVQVSYLLITAYKDQFLKIRFSYPNNQKEKGGEILKGFLSNLGKLLK